MSFRFKVLVPCLLQMRCLLLPDIKCVFHGRFDDLQAELGTASGREGALSAQIADLKQKQEQDMQQELDRLRAELAEFSSGMAQRDSELQVSPIILCQLFFTALIFLAVQWPQ